MQAACQQSQGIDSAQARLWHGACLHDPGRHLCRPWASLRASGRNCAMWRIRWRTRCAQGVPEVCPRCAQGVPKVCPRCRTGSAKKQTMTDACACPFGLPVRPTCAPVVHPVRPTCARHGSDSVCNWRINWRINGLARSVPEVRPRCAQGAHDGRGSGVARGARCAPGARCAGQARVPTGGIRPPPTVRGCHENLW